MAVNKATATVLNSSVEGTQKPHMISFMNHGWWTNDWDKLQIWDGIKATTTDAGFEQPPTDWLGDTAPTWSAFWTPVKLEYSNALGSRDYTTANQLVRLARNKFSVASSQFSAFLRYRYKDSKTGWVSNPSNAAVQIGISGAITIPIDNSGGENIKRAQTDTKVDTIVIERTVASGNVFYVDQEVLNTATSITITQSAQNDIALVDGANILDYPDFGHDAPPYGSILTAGRGRMWLAGHNNYTRGFINQSATTQVLGGSVANWTSAAVGRFIRPLNSISDAGKIDALVSAKELTLASAFPSVFQGSSYSIFSARPNRIYYSHEFYPCSFPPENVIDVLEDTQDELVGMSFLGQNLYVFGKRSMQRISYANDPLVATVETVPGGRGLVAKNFLMVHGGALWGMDYQGIWKFTGTGSPASVPAFPKQEIQDLLVADQGDDVHDTACFIASTLVYTPKGFIYISDLQLGDEVYSQDFDKGSVTTARVTSLHKSMVDEIITLKTGNTRIVCTPSHPFYTEQGDWINAGDLDSCSVLKSDTGKHILLDDIQKERAPRIVYNLSVAGPENYFVSRDKILVHNK